MQEWAALRWLPLGLAARLGTLLMGLELLFCWPGLPPSSEVSCVSAVQEKMLRMVMMAVSSVCALSSWNVAG